MALENKKYLDYAGLKRYDALIKQLINDSNSDIADLVTLIGAGSKEAGAQSLIERISEIETNIGDVSTLTTDSIKTIAQALVAERTRAEGAEKALADDLGEWTVAEGETAPTSTVKSRIESIEDVIGLGDTTDGKSLSDRVEDLEDRADDIEDLLAGDFGTKPLPDDAEDGAVAEKVTVKEYIDNKVDALDATNNVSDIVAGVTVQVEEVNGVVSKPVVTVADNEVKFVAAVKAAEGVEAQDAHVTVADKEAVLKGDAVAEIIKYVDAMDEANSSDAAAELKELKEDLYGADDDDNDDGKLGEIDDRLDDLEALHADKKNEDGEVIGKQTVKDEVDAGIAALVAGAPDALDTLKEIADWIANSTEKDGVTDAASLISRVDTLTGADTVDGSVAKSIKDAVEALDATVTNRVAKAEDATEDPAQPNVIATISEVDGKLTSVVIDDTVLESRLTALETNTDDADAVKALEKKLYGEGEGDAHVDGDLDKINAAIAAEQERAEGAEDDIMDFIGEIPEDAEAETVIAYVDEVVAAEEAARKAQIGELGKVSDEEGAADHTVKSYVDALAAKTAGTVELTSDLTATHTITVKGEGDAEDTTEEVTDSYGSIKITEVNGKLTAVEASIDLERITDAEIDKLFEDFDFIQYENITDKSM